METQRSRIESQQALRPMVSQAIPKLNLRVRINFRATKCLGFSQVVVGTLSAGIAALFLLIEIVWKYQADYPFSGIAAIACGISAMIAGFTGALSLRDPRNYCKSGINSAICIVTCAMAAVATGVYSRGLSIFYGHQCFKKTTSVGNRPFVQSSLIPRPCTTELAFTAVLFGLSVIQFFVALLASMYSSQFAFCGKEGCCQGSKKVTTTAQSNQPFVIANANGQTAFHSTDLTRYGLPPPYSLHERDAAYNAGALTMSSGSTGIYCDEPPPPYEHI